MNMETYARSLATIDLPRQYEDTCNLILWMWGKAYASWVKLRAKYKHKPSTTFPNNELIWDG